MLEKKISHPYFREKISKKIPHKLAAKILLSGYEHSGQALTPVLQVNYNRKYRERPDTSRVTIDSAIIFVELKSRKSMVLGATVVVEAKGSNYSDCVEIINTLGLNVSRFSKYCTGINCFMDNQW